MRFFYLISLLLSSSLLVGLSLAAADEGAEVLNENQLRQTKLVDLGRALFFDANLSKERTQSCATCHDPARAFSDGRGTGVAAAVSLGGDLKSIGDRNAPSISYAALTPEFHINSEGDYVGGMFWDGREANLAAQAGGPPLNLIEMGFENKVEVIQRLQENPAYLTSFKNLFGEDVFQDIEASYSEMTNSIAAFEKTEFFSPFDSKYDRYLRGEYELSKEEELGMTLFFSSFTNCNLCHQLNSADNSSTETFTNYRFHNIGLPKNKGLREINGLGSEVVDRGLFDNPKISALSEAGKFKVPSLRNVAITAPYMHNGIFKELKTVVQFYNKYNARGSAAQINPETGETWGEPEVADNISLNELQSGPSQDEKRVDALVAFLRTLTDKRYEPLLEPEN